MSTGPVKDRLFEEDGTKLTLEKALQIASAKEAASTQYDLPSSSIKMEPVGYVNQSGKGQKPIKHNANSNNRCQVCGNFRHSASNCRYKDFDCNICGVTGHLKNLCKKPKCK